MLELTDRQLGRYHLLRLLGFGGMGEVYLASAKGAAGFEKLVMEYVRGFSLRELIAFHSEQAEPFPIRPVAHALRCVADALDYLHRVRGPHKKPLGLIHRDISPSNILLGAEGRIKMSDFGVSGMAQDAARAGTVIGKPRYLPPEARHGEPPTQGWDVYALGVVLHSALAADPDIERGGSKIGARLAPLAELRPDIPAALVDIVARATARKAAHRLSDAALFRKLLDDVVPKQADDADFWREWLQGLYKREPFVARYGVLPYVEDLVPDLEADTAQPASVAYVETVVVDTLKPIRFGLSPALGVAAARTQGERVAAWLKGRFDREVRPVVVGDYRELVEAISEGELDFAWMPPISFVRAADRGVGVVALAQRFGRPTYESAIVVRADSPLVELADLRGKSISYVDRESASGYLFAADLIARELGPPDEVLEDQHFQGSHKAVTDAVRRKWVDAGVTYVVRDANEKIVYSGWLDLADGAEGGDVPLRVLATTAPIPCDAIAHRPGLAQGMVERLAKTLVEVDDDPVGRAVLEEVFHTTGMVRADLRIYDAVREAMQRVENC